MTGAQVMSLLNSDENKTFGAVFRTPVENSKGIPHILEHSVLCGSEKYPIKEPFVELMKGSLNTFLNAFTYPDRTCYPVASTNLQVGLSHTNCMLPHLFCKWQALMSSACALTQGINGFVATIYCLHGDKSVVPNPR